MKTSWFWIESFSDHLFILYLYNIYIVYVVH